MRDAGAGRQCMLPDVRYLQALSDPATQLSPISHLPNFLPPPRPPAACRPAAIAQMRNRDRGLVIGDRIINSDAEISSSPSDRVMPDHTAPEAKEMVMWPTPCAARRSRGQHTGNPAVLGSQASRHQCWGCYIASRRDVLSSIQEKKKETRKRSSTSFSRGMESPSTSTDLPCNQCTEY